MSLGDFCQGVAKSESFCTARRYNPGDEVFLCYGRHTNLELLEHYGFSMQYGRNPHDTAALDPQVNPWIGNP